MDWFLITARTVHFAACVSLAGVLAFECLIAGPVVRRDGGIAAANGLQRRLRPLAWASLALTLISGAAWLDAIAAAMSGESLGAALSPRVLGIVLTQTRIGEDWLLRLAFAVALSACLTVWSERRARSWTAIAWVAFGLSALILASLAWAGHGASDVGAPGELHLAGDILHLIGAGLWLGTLVPLELLLGEARRAGDTRWLAIARTAARRYTVLAVTSVTVLLAGGVINTWFLAGTIPALIGTLYGQLLLAKIALFVVMLLVAAFNLLRLTPRLDDDARAPRTIGQLRRNALIETAVGLGVLAIVGVLGILPPGLHTEPGWPFPFRIDFNLLTTAAKITFAVFAIGFCASIVTIVVAVAAGRKRLLGPPIIGLIVCIAFGGAPLRSGLIFAYPTTFYASPVPYDAASVVAGSKVYAANCVMCHGVDGRGDGPAAATLPIRPADLVAPHLFAHTVGDLFWWVGHGLGGVMPGFALVMTPTQRWNAVNFIRARAAGVLSADIGPTVSGAATPQMLDFAFESDGAQDTLSQTLKTGPVLVILYAPPTPVARLRQLALAQPQLAAAGLSVIAVGVAAGETEGSSAGVRPPYVVGVSADVKETLALFRSKADGGETELMLDRNGNIRARWTASDLASPAVITVDAKRAAAFGVAAPNHAGHGG